MCHSSFILRHGLLCFRHECSFRRLLRSLPNHIRSRVHPNGLQSSINKNPLHRSPHSPIPRMATKSSKRFNIKRHPPQQPLSTKPSHLLPLLRRCCIRSHNLPCYPLHRPDSSNLVNNARNSPDIRIKTSPRRHLTYKFLRLLLQTVQL